MTTETERREQIAQELAELRRLSEGFAYTVSDAQNLATRMRLAAMKIERFVAQQNADFDAATNGIDPSESKFWRDYLERRNTTRIFRKVVAMPTPHRDRS